MTTDRQESVVCRLKQTGGGPSVVGDDGQPIAELRAVTSDDDADPEIVAKLVAWRERFMKNFLTQFRANPERTRRWLQQDVLPDNSRVLFLVYSGGELVGQYAVAHIERESAALDNGILGERGVPSRLFEHVEVAVIRWCFDVLDLRRVSAQLFSTNIPALWLHRRVGLQVARRDPLAREEQGDDVVYRVDASAADSPFELVTMEIDVDTFRSKHPPA